MPNQKFAIIGLGQLGIAIAKSLSNRGAEVLAIDSDERLVDNIADLVAGAIALDATDKKALMSVDITSFDAVVVAIGENFEQLLLVTTLLLDLGVQRVISRARGRNQKMILQKIGVKEILSPEEEVGIVVAENLINPTVEFYLELPEEYCIVEVIAPDSIAGRQLLEIDMRSKYHLNLITIKRETPVQTDGLFTKVTNVIGIPHGKTFIEPGDSLVLFGKHADVDRFIHVNS